MTIKTICRLKNGKIIKHLVDGVADHAAARQFIIAQIPSATVCLALVGEVVADEPTSTTSVA